MILFLSLQSKWFTEIRNWSLIFRYVDKHEALYPRTGKLLYQEYHIVTDPND